jgi:hypothetical protein
MLPVRSPSPAQPGPAGSGGMIREFKLSSIWILARASSGSKNAPGYWDFFLSYTQRDAHARTIATGIFFKMKERGLTCWLDVKMNKLDMAAMEEGARNSRCMIAIITDNGKD